MQHMLRLLAGLLLGAVAASAAGSGAVSKSPVEKVVALLKDLQTKAAQDGEHEQKIYNKFACWCDKAMKAKADTIDKAKLELRSLSQEILRLKGKVATLQAEIDELAKALREAEEMVEEATALRQKENAAFQTETAETKQAIAAMQSAVEVLAKATATEPALLQQGAAAGRSAVRAALAVMPVSAADRVPQKSLSLLSAFLSSREGYAPQSMTVHGILKDMYATFASDLESATLKEAMTNKDFELLIATKAAEMQQMKEAKAKREDEKAEAEAELATSTELFDVTGQQRMADIKFFDATQESCVTKSDEWTERKAMRAEEIKGIEEALEILTSDSARELFASAIKAGKEVGADSPASFLQVASDSNMAAAPAKAYAALKAVRSQSLRLAQLAVAVRTAKVGHFDQVIKAIDEMVAVVQEEDASDIEKRDHCKSEYHKVESKSKDLTWKIKNNVATIDKLDALIDKRRAEKEQTIEDIKALDGEVAAMKAQRKEENDAFLAAKADDEAAIGLLETARTALTKYYKQHNITMGKIQGSVKELLQQEPEFAVDEFQAPDATFAGKGSRKGDAKGIVSIMSYLIEDLHDEIKNGKKSEAKAQLEFEEAYKAAMVVREDLVDKKATFTQAIARLGQEKTDEETDKASNEGDLQAEVDYKERIKPDCDWIIGAFEERAKRRAAELQGLGAAKDYLAGATPALLQTKAGAVDDNALARIGFLSLSPARRA